MSQTHDEVRALRVMVDELRAEAPPELPWDAIEQRLLSRLSHAPYAPPSSRLAQADARPISLRRSEPGSSLARVLGFAAAAAVLALGISTAASSSGARSLAAPARHAVVASAIGFEPGSSTVHDLSALREGDVVEARDAPVSFGRPGLVAWTLAPGSALRVRSEATVGHTVVLERGSLRAEVTPRDPSEGLVEAFAVEAAGTRVAVHGTAFSVTLAGDRAVVDVEHGAVAVGPVGYLGATTGHLLVGPSRASFSLDGGRSARLMDRAPEPVVVAVADLGPASPPSPGDPAGVPATEERPAEPVAAPSVAQGPQLARAGHAPAPLGGPVAVAPAPAEVPLLTAGVVRARLERCFKQTSLSGSSGLAVSVSTTLRIDVNPDGSPHAIFDPPVKPELVPCAGSAIAGRFAVDTGHIDIPVTFQP